MEIDCHTFLLTVLALVDAGGTFAGHMTFLVAVATFSSELARFGAVRLGLRGMCELGSCRVVPEGVDLRGLPDPGKCH